MRKNCVRWNSVRSFLVITAVIASALGTSPTAQSPDPSAQPLLTFANVQYLGAFRLPDTASNGDTFSFGGRQLAFNPAGNTLFVGSRAGRIAEVSIPTPINSANPVALPFAGFVQGFFDPTEGHLSQVSTDGVALDSLMVYGNRLYGTAVIYYDANNSQRVSHFSRSLQLHEPSFQGWSAVWQADKSGYVSGAMSPVPSEWQSALGGPAVTGQCCVPIVTRTSWGPAAFAFNPAQIGQPLVSASPLLYYDGLHPTLGTWDNASPIYGASIQMGGMVIVPGTRSALYFGSIGTGPNCYGNGTGNAALAGTRGPDGELYCFDPTNSDKGSHQYPYRYQIWAYDLNDFAAVKAGTKQPWQVQPYGVWPFDLPTSASQVRLGGIGFDPASRTLYISQLYGDQDGYSFRPMIHALRLDAGQSTPPAEDTPVSAVSLTSNLPAPQAAGTMVRFAAAAHDGTGPVQYKWMTHDGASWTPRSDWTTSTEFTVAAPSGTFRTKVMARSSHSHAESGEASAEMDFTTASPSTRVSSVTISADKASPQAPGTPIQFSAAAAGGTAPQYKWWLYDGATWTMVRDWSASNLYAWTPATAGANYRMSVWARSGSSTDVYEATTEMYFVITGPTPTARVTNVSLVSNLASPQPANTTITWTAIATGGVSPHYRWQLFDGTSWSTVKEWSASNTFSWTPTAASANYRVSVWARSGASTDVYEATTEAYFAVTGPAQSPRVTSVELTSNVASPQGANAIVVWKATATGGTSPQYKWWFYDGTTWTMVRDWSPAATLPWSPERGGAVANPNYRMSVWARSGNSTEVYEATTEANFPITAVPAPSPRVTSVTLSANLASPQRANTAVTWTAVPTGGIAPHQYQYWLFDGATWVTMPWSTSNTFTWTPTSANANYRVSVWVKSAGNPGIYEASTEVYFPITP
jgi:hypothetical protein